MSSEVHKHIEEALDKNLKHIEKALDKNHNLFDENIINFPNDKEINITKKLKTKVDDVWKISDKSNDDQLKAVTGLCFTVGVLVIIGLYSNLT